MKLLTVPNDGMPGRPRVYEFEVDFSDAGAASAAAGISIPANSRVRVLVNRKVAINSGTTCTLSVGKTGSVTSYVNALDVKGATGINTEATAWEDTATAIIYSVTSVGTAPTAGQIKIAVEVTRLS